MAKPKGSEKIGGRVKGTPNKVTSDIRDKFNLLVQGNLDQLDDDLKALTPKDRVNAVIQLAAFCVPKLQSVALEDKRESAGKIEKALVKLSEMV